MKQKLQEKWDYRYCYVCGFLKHIEGQCLGSCICTCTPYSTKEKERDTK